MKKKLTQMLKRENEIDLELNTLQGMIYNLKNEHVLGEVAFSYRKQAKIEKLEEQFKTLNCKREKFLEEKKTLLNSEEFLEYKNSLYQENLKKFNDFKEDLQQKYDSEVTQKYLEIYNFKQEIDKEIRNIQDEIEANNNSLMRFCGKKDKYIINTNISCYVPEYSNWLHEHQRKEFKKTIKAVQTILPELSVADKFNNEMTVYARTADLHFKQYIRDFGPVRTARMIVKHRYMKYHNIEFYQICLKYKELFTKVEVNICQDKITELMQQVV